MTTQQCQGFRFTGGFTQFCSNRSSGTFTFRRTTRTGLTREESQTTGQPFEFQSGEQTQQCMTCGRRGERFGEGTFQRG